ncbi:MAG TPA: DUF4350 domain-containing protein [Ignavibacteriaceae bacterium]|nr:DUF4350 domain-containing protein [Ignavibacteriaceae bacterium]
MKKYSRFIFVLGITILLLIIFQVSSPKEIDWSLSFSSEDKIPYGSYILYRMLPELFPEKKITAAYYPAYNNLYERGHINSAYIFLNNDFSPDELDSRELIKYVKSGNYVFACANYFGGKLFDSLKANTNISFTNKDSAEINFFSDSLKKESPYQIKKSNVEFYFNQYDTLNTVILGINKNNKPNFIRTSFGEGFFYLSTVPEAFTNLTLLDSVNSEYAYKAISYLPSRLEIIWDEYYKANKSMVRTPLRYILSRESLKWSYYILIFSIIIYIIFQGKRKQRIIPIIPPLKNTTLEFVRLIGKLYYQQKDHKNIAQKKINFFLDYLRNRYSVRTDELNPEAVEKISLKSGTDKTDVKTIFNYINYIDISKKIKEEELKRINFLIETFYKKAGVYGRSK